MISFYWIGSPETFHANLGRKRSGREEGIDKLTIWFAYYELTASFRIQLSPINHPFKIYAALEKMISSNFKEGVL